MKRITVFTCFFSLLALGISAQYNPYYQLYQLDFKDKAQTLDYPYSPLRPKDFMAASGLVRRQNLGIEIGQGDLPLDPSYEQQILDLGLRIHAKSKWFNALCVVLPDSSSYEQVKALPFVAKLSPLGLERKPALFLPLPAPPRQDLGSVNNRYGKAFNQIAMLQGHYLHALGYQGQGLHLGVFDGGFNMVYRMPAFDSLYAQHRLWHTFDFVQGDEIVYEGSSHGTHVLATMTAQIPGQIVGTAPQAAYSLFKTEDTQSEHRIEEFNWLSAIETADSLGIQLINSSLGYTKFSDTTMSYQYADMNGQTALISRAANQAALRGLLVFNSAGNEGNKAWHHVGAPADAAGTFSIAAVRANGQKADFSSFGPTADARPKPDVAAQGQATVIANYEFGTSTTSGTSFSSPVLAGMTASLWQAAPKQHPEIIKQTLRESAHQFQAIDSALGAGIPNFLTALSRLAGPVIFVEAQAQPFYFLDRNRGFYLDEAYRFHIIFDYSDNIDKPLGLKINLNLYNTMGDKVWQREAYLNENKIYAFQYDLAQELAAGVYSLELSVEQTGTLRQTLVLRPRTHF